MWSLIAMPALCVSGVVEHHCDCAAPTGCNHESRCENDPCSGSMARVQKENHDENVNGPPAPCGPALTIIEIANLTKPTFCDFTSAPSGSNLPYRESDTPLLI